MYITAISTVFVLLSVLYFVSQHERPAVYTDLVLCTAMSTQYRTFSINYFKSQYLLNYYL